MRVLVLGGTHHVGRAIVESALRRGDDVTTLTRGVSGPPAAGARALHADRTNATALATALADQTFDAVLDTWSLAPAAVQHSVRLLSGRAAHYGYVSSRSIYHGWTSQLDADESAPVVAGQPHSEAADDYAAAKRGGELAAEEFDGPVLLARAGLILGPYENVGRLPFWLNRIARGGRVPAPGPYDRPLQCIDARDLATWMLESAERGVSGAYNTVSRPGHTTIGALLDECNTVTGNHAELAWLEPAAVERAGVAAWTELPIWVPPTGELAGLHAANVDKAMAAGLGCRPMPATVADTWSWLQAEGPAQPATNRAGAPMDEAAEQRFLAEADRR